MSSRQWAVLLAGITALTVGCHSDPAASGSKTEWFSLCQVSEDCPTETDCLTGICTVECTGDEACAEGLCHPKADAESGLQLCLPTMQIPFSEPVLLALDVPETSDIDDPTFTEDRLEMYFAVGGHSDGAELARIWRSTRASIDDAWGEPSLADSLNDESLANSMPAVTSDGLTLYFIRDPEADVRQLYVATRPTRGAVWSTPELLVFNAFGAYGDSPSGTADGLMLTWSRKEGEQSEVLLAERASVDEPWEFVRILDELSGDGTGRYEPWISDDGLTIFYREGADIYAASRETRDEAFQDPHPVEELNTDAFSEGDPWLSQDTRNMMFASDRDGTWKIYETSR